MQPPPGDDFYDPSFTPEEMNNPNPNFPQPPFYSHNQPDSPGNIFFFSASILYFRRLKGNFFYPSFSTLW